MTLYSWIFSGRLKTTLIRTNYVDKRYLECSQIRLDTILIVVLSMLIPVYPKISEGMMHQTLSYLSNKSQLKGYKPSNTRS